MGMEISKRGRRTPCSIFVGIGSVEQDREPVREPERTCNGNAATSRRSDSRKSRNPLVTERSRIRIHSSLERATKDLALSEKREVRKGDRRRRSPDVKKETGRDILS